MRKVTDFSACVPPADAARLAAGEVVRVWVAMERQPVQGYSYRSTARVADGYFAVFCAPESVDQSGPFDWVSAPAASGDRVEVECPECDGDGYGPCYGLDGEPRVASCPICPGTGRLTARVLADPEPGRWCERCKGVIAGERLYDTERWWDTCHEPLDSEVVYDRNVCPRCPVCNTALGGWPDQCPDCHGTPPWGRWYNLQLEGAAPAHVKEMTIRPAGLGQKEP